IGWSPQSGPGRSFDEFVVRLAAQGARWQAKGINFYPSGQVPWRLEATTGDFRTPSGRTLTGLMATVSFPQQSATPPPATVDWGDGTSSPGFVAGAPGV